MPVPNLARLRELMAADGLDAVMAFTSENYRYLSGYQPAALILKATGAFATLIPTDPSTPSAMIVSAFDTMWAAQRSHIADIRGVELWVQIDDQETWDTGGGTALERRPTQFDWDQALALQRAILGERDLLRARIGCELEKLPASFRQRLEREFADINFVDATELLHEVQAVKTSEEIDLLRQSVVASEFGMRSVMMDSDPRGKTVSQLRAEFEIAVMRHLSSDPGLNGFESNRVYMTAGGTIGPNAGRNEDVVNDGDIVWIDCGVKLDGYEADIGRTFQVGRAKPLTETIAAALSAGSTAGFEVLTGPGVAHRAVHEATQRGVRENGIPWYTRGHVGHAVGIGGGEHHPFISPDEPRPFEPGMVFAFERPYYVRGLGGFQNEDNIAVTQSGMDVFGSMPQGLIRV